MKLLVPDAEAFNGMKVIDVPIPPKDVICAWPEEIDEKFADVVLVNYQTHEGKVRYSVEVSDHLIMRRILAAPEDKRFELAERYAMGKKSVVIMDELKKLQVVEVNSNVQPANFVADAPAGVRLGDEDCLSLDANLNLVADHAGLENKYSPANQERTWNEKSVFERIRDAYRN